MKASPLRKVKVCSRCDRIASTSRARKSSSVVPSSGKSPSGPSRRSNCSRSFSACLSPVRTRACSSRARCRNRRRTYWERHSSFLFFSPYFFKSSFSALMRSASHGWDGRSNFARENFGSPNDSLLLLRRRLLLFLLFFFLGRGFLRLLGLRGLEGGLLRHPVRRLLRQIAEAFRARHAGQVGDGLGHADPDARDRREGVPDRARTVEVRVRHPDDVAEVLFHAFEFLRRPRGLRLLFFLFLLL